MKRLIHISLVCLVSLAVAVQSGLAREPAVDPGTGRIRIIYLGDSWGVMSAYQYLVRDPIFWVTPVPASSGHMGGLSNLSRYIRLYIPRTYNRLVSSQDVIILSDTVKAFYTSHHIIWFRDAVQKGGRGIVMVGGREIQEGDWPGTPVEEALPVEWIQKETYENPFMAFPTSPSNDFLDSLPWETMPPYLGMNLAVAKEGSRILLQADVEEYPVLVFWEFGQGAGLAHTPDWTPAWGGPTFFEWPYYGDFVANMMYLSAGKEIPGDPALMHDIREEFFLFSIQWGIVTGMAEFVERFGANVRPVEERLREIDGAKREASQLYMEQEYDEVLDRMRHARSELDGTLELALEIKDRALVWIYITEATAITGTLLICGFAIWVLMVKRRFYREVATTRAFTRGDE